MSRVERTSEWAGSEARGVVVHGAEDPLLLQIKRVVTTTIGSVERTVSGVEFVIVAFPGHREDRGAQLATRSIFILAAAGSLRRLLRAALGQHQGKSQPVNLAACNWVVVDVAPLGERAQCDTLHVLARTDGEVDLYHRPYGSLIGISCLGPVLVDLGAGGSEPELDAAISVHLPSPKKVDGARQVSAPRRAAIACGCNGVRRSIHRQSEIALWTEFQRLRQERGAGPEPTSHCSQSDSSCVHPAAPP